MVFKYLPNLMFAMCLPRSYISCMVRLSWDWILLCASELSPILEVKLWFVLFHALSIVFAAVARLCSTSDLSFSLLALVSIKKGNNNASGVPLKNIC